MRVFNKLDSINCTEKRKMPEILIDKPAYDQGMLGCAPADEIKPGKFFVERQKLAAANDERFARELLVKVLAKRNEEGFPTIVLERLADDGRPLGEQEVTVDPDGIIISANWDEKGYLIGGVEADDSGFNRTKEELFAPILLEAEKPQEVRYLEQPALGEPEEQWAA
jgi:hypothetical protein